MPKAKRVLVVDDEASIREGLEEYLTSMGYKVILAKDGYEAFKLTIDEDFDIILMDINMPRMNGLEAIRAIKESRPAVPIIIVSGYFSKEDEKKGYQLGVVKFIRKPFKGLEVLESIKKVIDKEKK